MTYAYADKGAIFILDPVKGKQPTLKMPSNIHATHLMLRLGYRYTGQRGALHHFAK